MRRRFFLFAAPAIVAAPSLMKVSTLILPDYTATGVRALAAKQSVRLSELIAETLRARSDLLAENIRRNNLILQMIERENLRLSIEREVTGISDLMRG